MKIGTSYFFIPLKEFAKENIRPQGGRIENYDFIKGIAILFVILHHVLMVYAELPLHTVFTIKNAVPLFIIVTILLRYKKLEHSSLSQYWRTIVNELLKVFLPFCISLILLFAYIHPNFIQIIKFQIGWGSYYPLVYAQLIIMAPIAYKVCKKNITQGTLLILSFCIVTEILFSYLDIPLWFYRLLFTRYAFLYVISYLLLEKQILSKYKGLMILFAILGGIFIYVHCYFNVNLFFYPGWIGSKFPRDFISLVWFIILFKLCDILHYKIKKVIT